jgi:allantoate deiminase
VPMRLRRDALAAGAECVLAVERLARAQPEVVGTVGRIEAQPGAINVIPGEVQFTIDVRAPLDAARSQAVDALRTEIAVICQNRGVAFEIETLQELGSSTCAPWLMARLERAVQSEGVRVLRLPSGAGHDGMALKAIADIAMLFVRCRRGISHNPAEAISAEDAGTGTRILHRFIHDFRPGLPA